MTQIHKGLLLNSLLKSVGFARASLPGLENHLGSHPEPTTSPHPMMLLSVVLVLSFWSCSSFLLRIRCSLTVPSPSSRPPTPQKTLPYPRLQHMFKCSLSCIRPVPHCHSSEVWRPVMTEPSGAKSPSLPRPTRFFLIFFSVSPHL